MKLSFVVPVLNESQNLTACADRIRRACDQANADFEILFVDDGSTDGTADLLHDLHQKNNRIKALLFSRNFGHQAAISAGLETACGDAVITMDGDLEHPPEVLPALLAAWKDGAQIVNTLRETPVGSGFLKNAVSRVFYRLFALLTNIRLPHNAADFRLLDKNVVTAFRQMKERHRFVRGLVSWMGYRTSVVTYTPGVRDDGRSRYSWSKMFALGLDGILSFSVIPLLGVIAIGFLVCLLGFFYSAYILYIKLIAHHAVPGWASIALVVSLMGGIQLLVLGVMGLYLSRIYDEVKQRPLYLVRSTIGLA